MSAGRDFSLFVKTDGSLWGYGSNEYGQLGDGITTNLGVSKAQAPTITSQPSGQVLSEGRLANFAVVAIGGAPLEFQWVKDGVAISGATRSSFFPMASTQTAGSYTVIVTNSAGSLTSTPATLTIGGPPSIVTQPSTQRTTFGGSANFAVVATGTAPLAYQWAKDGIAINGATAATLSLNSTTSSDAGGYTVVVANSLGAETSTSATLSFHVLPTITAQPIGITLTLGLSASLTVVAVGTAPLTYQWAKDGIAISGARAPNYSLSSAATSDAGSYTVTVSNSAGMITSTAAALAFRTPLSISTQPSAQVVIAGGSATFSVVANGSPPPTYQWRKNGTAINGATANILTLTSAATTDTGTYTVVVTNSVTSVTSTEANLTVNSPPAITSQPSTQVVVAGDTPIFSAVASGTAPLAYQWAKDGIAINGATAATYRLGSTTASSAGNYTVTVTNSAGSVTSTAAILTVAASNPGRLINLSILTTLSVGDERFTMGYVVGGAESVGAKPLVIRAAGPSLGALGVPGTISDPKLELFAGAIKTGENDDWGGSANLTSALAAVGAFAYIGPTSKDAATTANIVSRDNSVVVSAARNDSGLVIAEIYDATPTASFSPTTPRLINVSVRKHLGTGLTVGFVLGGSSPTKVLIRAVGPTLGAFGVPDVVVDPQLALFDGKSAKIGENNDWGGTVELTAAFNAVGAFALPVTSKDAAVLVTLPPGNYSVQASGTANTTGVALVEVYEVR